MDKLHWAEALAAGTLPLLLISEYWAIDCSIFSLAAAIQPIPCPWNRETENRYLSHLLASMLCVTISEVCRSLGRYCCSCLIQQHSHPVADGYQISLAQFCTGEAKLADSYHLPVYHMPWHSFQEHLFHDLTGLRMFQRTSILPLLKMSAMFLCFSVAGHFIWLPGLLKYAWERLGNYISHFLHDSDVHPIGSCSLLYLSSSDDLTMMKRN